MMQFVGDFYVTEWALTRQILKISTKFGCYLKTVHVWISSYQQNLDAIWKHYMSVFQAINKIWMLSENSTCLYFKLQTKFGCYLKTVHVCISNYAMGSSINDVTHIWKFSDSPFPLCHTKLPVLLRLSLIMLQNSQAPSPLHVWRHLWTAPMVNTYKW